MCNIVQNSGLGIYIYNIYIYVCIYIYMYMCVYIYCQKIRPDIIRPIVLHQFTSQISAIGNCKSALVNILRTCSLKLV